MTTTQHLRELLTKATPGKWEFSTVPDTRETEIGTDNMVPVTGRTELLDEDDAALIVAAINALPNLLDVVEAAKEYVGDDWNHRDPTNLENALKTLDKP